MLIIQRKAGDDGVIIGGNILVKVTRIEGQRAWIGIEAPKDVPISRIENGRPVQSKLQKHPDRPAIQ